MMGYRNIMPRRRTSRASVPSSLSLLSRQGPRTRATRRKARSAFSLAELMIAIVILGLGLLMVAGMFPVGWIKARELAEYTTSQSIVKLPDGSWRIWYAARQKPPFVHKYFAIGTARMSTP